MKILGYLCLFFFTAGLVSCQLVGAPKLIADKTTPFDSKGKSLTPEIDQNSMIKETPTLKLPTRIDDSYEYTNTPIVVISPTMTIEPQKIDIGKYVLAFAASERSNSGIHVYSNDTKQLINVTQGFKKYGWFMDPSWSPDGKYIVYSWDPTTGPSSKIRIVNFDGTNDHFLANGYEPAWSPDGNLIVYCYNGNIYTINLDSGYIAPIIVTSNRREDFPAWSPDGKRIAFLASDIVSGFTANLNIMNSDGSGIQRVEMDIKPDWGRISWFPDGMNIAFRSSDGCGDIYTVDVETGITKQITHTLSGEKDPSLSPNGKWIVFMSTDEATLCNQGNIEPLVLGWQAYIMNSNGQNVQPLLGIKTDADMSAPAWNPVISLEIGKSFSITSLGDHLRLRESPSKGAAILEQLNYGDIIIPTEGPKVNEGYRWWFVKIENTELSGWVVEEPGWFRLSQ